MKKSYISLGPVQLQRMAITVKFACVKVSYYTFQRLTNKSTDWECSG